MVRGDGCGIFLNKFRDFMKERARILRQDMTDAENRMWYFLRDR